jgi:hypothetical protein
MTADFFLICENLFNLRHLPTYKGQETRYMDMLIAYSRFSFVLSPFMACLPVACCLLLAALLPFRPFVACLFVACCLLLAALLPVALPCSLYHVPCSPFALSPFRPFALSSFRPFPLAPFYLFIIIMTMPLISFKNFI